MGLWLWGLNFGFLNVSDSFSSFLSNRFVEEVGRDKGRRVGRVGGSYQILSLTGGKKKINFHHSPPLFIYFFASWTVS